MPLRPTWPSGVVQVTLEVVVNEEGATTSFWLFAPGGDWLDPITADQVVTNFVVNPMQYFLDCMSSSATIRTCRLRQMGNDHFTWLAVLAPNAGALSGDVTFAVAAGVYIQGTTGGRGSGTRIRIPGIGGPMVEQPGKLTTYGIQQLQFLADGLAVWPSQLAGIAPPGIQLGTLQTKRAGNLLNPPEWDPALVIRPTFRLETVSRRMHSFERISTP